MQTFKVWLALQDGGAGLLGARPPLRPPVARHLLQAGKY